MVPLSTVLDGANVRIGYVCSNNHLILSKIIDSVKGITHSAYNGEDCSGTLFPAYTGKKLYGLVCTKCNRIFKTDQLLSKVLKALEDAASENKMPFATLKQVLNRLEGYADRRKVKEVLETLKELKYVAEIEREKYAVVELCGDNMKKVIEKYGTIFFHRRQKEVCLISSDSKVYPEKLVKKEVKEALAEDYMEKIYAEGT